MQHVSGKQLGEVYSTLRLAFFFSLSVLLLGLLHEGSEPNRQRRVEQGGGGREEVVWTPGNNSKIGEGWMKAHSFMVPLGVWPGEP